MLIFAALVAFISASAAAVIYALHKAPDAFEGDEGLEIVRQHERGERLREGTVSDPRTTV